MALFLSHAMKLYTIGVQKERKRKNVSDAKIARSEIEM